MDLERARTQAQAEAAKIRLLVVGARIQPLAAVVKIQAPAVEVKTRLRVEAGTIRAPALQALQAFRVNLVLLVIPAFQEHQVVLEHQVLLDILVLLEYQVLLDILVLLEYQVVLDILVLLEYQVVLDILAYQVFLDILAFLEYQAFLDILVFLEHQAFLDILVFLEHQAFLGNLVLSGTSGISGFSGISGMSGMSGIGVSGFSGMPGRSALPSGTQAGPITGPEIARLQGKMLESKLLQEKQIDPLAAVKQRIEEMNAIEPSLAAVIAQRLGLPQPEPQEPAYTYGQETSIDDILNLGGRNYADGGYVEPLRATGGAMNPQFMYRSGGVLPGGREDFKGGKHVAGDGDGQSDDIPAWLADGEFVFPADVVSALGNGSTKAGTDKLYQMMHEIRARARSTKVKDLPPPAHKSPLDYLRKGYRDWETDRKSTRLNSSH